MTNPPEQVIPDEAYNPRKDAHDSYFVAIEAKKARGDHLEDRIWALERNLLALERYYHDLQADIQDMKKALHNG